MDNKVTIAIELLSAGVIAALVTGIFSLIIAIKNNKRLIELEKKKQKFTMDQERYKALRSAYDELLNLLPEEKLLGHVIMNMPSRKDFQENGLSEAFEIAEVNMKIMYSHFQKHCYLLSDDEQEQIQSEVEAIDSISKSIIAGLWSTDTENSENDDDSISDDIHGKVLERLLKVTEFEKLYYDSFRDNLSKLAK